MNDLLELSERLIGQVSLDFSRYLLHEINWNNRLIGIKGARGTGKTTMLLQWLHKKKLPSSKAVYFSIDELYFTTHNLLEVGCDFYNKGGKILILDEVHKYSNWAIEIKNLYDRYHDLQIVFTGSSIIDISRQQGDLSRRAIVYELFGLSYREYLQMNGVLDLQVLSLQEIISPKANIRSLFPSTFRPLEHFESYLAYGYYPFSIEDKEGFHLRLRQLIRLIVEFDMAELKGFDIRNAKKMLQMITIIGQSVPFKPNLIKLAEKSQIHRNSIGNYLIFLEEARLISLLYPSGISIATLQKPEKIYMNNTNLIFALSHNQPDKGNLRETFLYNQLKVKHKIRQPKSADFEVDNKLILEVGGISKGRKQISNLTDAFVVKDNMEFPVDKALPLWLFGFLY
ncbi:MAG: AAA family ATPase [Bacteroidales bacterium]|jgi:predicted AAA+ superfamily ATPase|nr:AAA family ATPase [Bacteroidales bacterium]